MADETDVVDDAGSNRLVAITALAAAAIGAPGASAAEREFAHAVLKEMSARKPAAENGDVAWTFNREMDVVLDAANDSHRARDRATRRIEMARALDRGNLILIDKGTLARFFADGCELELAKVRIAELDARPSFGLDPPGGMLFGPPDLVAATHHSEPQQAANPNVND